MLFKKKTEKKQSFVEYEKEVLDRAIEQEFVAQRVRFIRDKKRHHLFKVFVF